MEAVLDGKAHQYAGTLARLACALQVKDTKVLPHASQCAKSLVH